MQAYVDAGMDYPIDEGFDDQCNKLIYALCLLRKLGARWSQEAMGISFAKVRTTARLGTAARD